MKIIITTTDHFSSIKFSNVATTFQWKHVHR